MFVFFYKYKNKENLSWILANFREFARIIVNSREFVRIRENSREFARKSKKLKFAVIRGWFRPKNDRDELWPFSRKFFQKSRNRLNSREFSKNSRKFAYPNLREFVQKSRIRANSREFARIRANSREFARKISRLPELYV